MLDFSTRQLLIPLSCSKPWGPIYLAYTLLRRISLVFCKRLLLHQARVDNWILSNASFAPTEMILQFCFFSLLILWITILTDFQMLTPCILGVNPTWSFYIILFIYCWMKLAKIVFRILAPVGISLVVY